MTPKKKVKGNWVLEEKIWRKGRKRKFLGLSPLPLRRVSRRPIYFTVIIIIIYFSSASPLPQELVSFPIPCLDPTILSFTTENEIGKQEVD